MAHAACDLMWIQNVMKELGVKNKGSIIMFFDNQVTIYIASNLIFLLLNILGWITIWLGI